MNIGTKEALALGFPYLITVGCCHLFGYWGTFNINVLEFISFADTAKIAVYPLAASLVFTLAGFLVCELIPVFRMVLGRKYSPGLIAFYIAIAILVATFAPEPNKWFIIAVLVALLSTPLTHVEKIKELVPTDQVRSITLFLLLLLPASSFAIGRQQAFFVKTGASEQFVDVTRSKLPLASDAKNPVAYLGLLGNVYILREAKTGQIVLVKQRDDAPLFLAPKPQ